VAVLCWGQGAQAPLNLAQVPQIFRVIMVHKLLNTGQLDTIVLLVVASQMMRGQAPQIFFPRTAPAVNHRGYSLGGDTFSYNGLSWWVQSFHLPPHQTTAMCWRHCHQLQDAMRSIPWHISISLAWSTSLHVSAAGCLHYSLAALFQLLMTQVCVTHQLQVVTTSNDPRALDCFYI